MASLTDPVVLPPSPSPSERPPSSSPKKERSPVIKERRSLETPDVEEMARFAAKTVHHEYEEEKDSGPLERLPLFYTVHSIGNNTGITVEEAQEFEAHHKEPPGTLVMRVTMKALRIGHFDAHPGTMNAEEVKAAVSPDTKIEVKTPTPPNVGPPSPVHPIEAGEARSPGILASPARVTFPIVSESPASPARVTFPIVPRSPASPARVTFPVVPRIPTSPARVAFPTIPPTPPAFSVTPEKPATRLTLCNSSLVTSEGSFQEDRTAEDSFSSSDRSNREFTGESSDLTDESGTDLTSDTSSEDDTGSSSSSTDFEIKRK